MGHKNAKMMGPAKIMALEGLKHWQKRGFPKILVCIPSVGKGGRNNANK